MSMRLSYFIVHSIFMTAIAACSTPSLSQRASQVNYSHEAPGPSCRRLGNVVGTGGGAIGGGWVSNADLVEYAEIDARNEAAELGANYVQLSACNPPCPAAQECVGTAGAARCQPVASPPAAPVP